MVLGLDYGELALVVGAGAVLFGPKDLPKLSRFSGKIVGWAVGYLQHARGHIQEIGGTSELARIHQEMQATLHELHSIRNEVRQGARILSPMNTISSSGNAHISEQGSTPHSIPTSSSGIGSLQGQNSSSVPWEPTSHVTEPSAQPKPLSHLASEFPLHDPFIAERLGSNMLPPPEDSANRGTLGRIPVSAVSAGLTQLRESSASGSDILLDALLEEEVAHKAQAFLESDERKGSRDS